MECTSVPIGDLLPHGPEMTLLERLVEYAPQRSVATLTVRQSSRFYELTGVPAWVGIEYMAQTIAAHAGYEARLRGVLPAVGFLVGTRDFRTEVAEFSLGATLAIAVEPLFVDARLASFQCTIAIHSVVATAVVNTYRPGLEELAAAKQRAHSV
jgi:predicted hotdog family 3-hydroxylacyl-ACP dehydratase